MSDTTGDVGKLIITQRFIASIRRAERDPKILARVDELERRNLKRIDEIAGGETS